MYADHQVIIAEPEDELQIAVNELNKVIKKYDTKTSSSKTRTMGLNGKNMQTVKLEIERKM
jgi:hypothetical protein